MNIFIASDVRSGSTYLAEAIAYALFNATGLDFFNLTKEKFRDISDLSSSLEISEVFDQIYVNELGIRCSKIMCSSLSVIFREMQHDESLRSRFLCDDSIWIVLMRRDKVAQAVSLAFANLSGVYHYYGDPKCANDRSVVPTNADVYACLSAILLSEVYLGNIIKLVNNPIEVYYEDIYESANKVVEELIDRCGLNVDVKGSVSSLVKLKRTAADEKKIVEEEFRRYFVMNYHKILREM